MRTTIQDGIRIIRRGFDWLLGTCLVSLHRQRSCGPLVPCGNEGNVHCCTADGRHVQESTVYDTSAFDPLIQVLQQVVIDKCAPPVFAQGINPAHHTCSPLLRESSSPSHNEGHVGSSSRLHTEAYIHIAAFRAKGRLFHPTTRYPMLLAIVSFHFPPCLGCTLHASRRHQSAVGLFLSFLADSHAACYTSLPRPRRSPCHTLHSRIHNR